VSSWPKLRLNWTRDINGALEAQVGYSVLDDLEVDGDDAGHFDGAAEGNLAVTLGEVQVADAELGAVYVDWEVDFGSLCGMC